MNRIYKYILLLCACVMTTVIAQAQAQGIPYACGFEEDEDLSNWVMVHRYSAHAQDQWMIGSAVRCEGKRSMYISADGTNAVYGSQPNITVSYLTFKFPDSNKQQNYDISFDWKCSGDSLNSKLYVMVCPEQLLHNEAANNYFDLNKITSSVSGILNRNVAAACEPLGASRAPFLYSSKEWQNTSLSNELRVSPARSRQPFAIVFIWVNNNTNPDLQQTGICIDNVQIGDATIKKPQNLTVEPICGDSAMLVSWESGASEFEVQYRAVGSSTWRRADGLTDGVDGFTRVNGTQCSYILQRIKEGSYDVRVQAKAAGILSNWTYKNLILVYCPENHCINYLEFNSPDVVCTYGMTYNGGKGTPFDNVGWIDFGPDSKESRHTIHVDPTELDPRTDSSLHTVPQGALASVRLGNWDTGYEAEGITYSFVVDGQNQGILIIKYAVVLNKPNTSCGDPGFKMVVLDENGEVIDESCGKADFTYSSAAAAGWNETKDASVVWKDWTTV
ncbi:MAG: fibronectin type III domain-containing protein, partial [Paludibacteraceae bacterium]|nr:fibronectin type III domain-containing protein [Paludibacteraceae bacterium]